MTDPGHNDSPERHDSATRAGIIARAFDNDHARFAAFMERVRDVTPSNCDVILRGSAVTGKRWEDGAPFDADGPGTSDLDLTWIGGDMIQHWEGFYIPGLHTLPLSDEHPNACPRFVPLREELSRLARRPVNLQATSQLVQYARDVLMDQPYFTLIRRAGEEAEETSGAQ